MKNDFTDWQLEELYKIAERRGKEKAALSYPPGIMRDEAANRLIAVEYAALIGEDT